MIILLYIDAIGGNK